MNRPTPNGLACSSAIYSTSRNYLVECGAVRRETRRMNQASAMQNRTYR